MKASDFGDIISWSRVENCNHGSRNMSFVLGRLSGFLWKILRRSWRPWREMWSWRGSSCLQMFVYNSLSFWPLKGNRPQSRAYRRTPRAQISAGGPAYSILLTISGAMYDGVPQNIFTFLSCGMQVENPKSISFTRVRVSSRSMFSSLMSLCVTFR